MSSLQTGYLIAKNLFFFYKKLIFHMAYDLYVYIITTYRLNLSTNIRIILGINYY